MRHPPIPIIRHKTMKQLAFTFTLIAFSVPLLASAGSPCASATPEILAKKLSDAYVAKQLGRLDGDRPYLENVKFLIEHSISGEYQVEEVQSLENGQKWLKSLEIQEGMPARESRPLLWCEKGFCIFNFEEGISHNHLYLQKIEYGFRNQCPYITTVFLLDGD